MTSHLLYRNGDHTITLLDLPRSLEEAQNNQLEWQILSSPPPQLPYVVSEPKGHKRDNLLLLMPPEQYHYLVTLRSLILEALTHIRRNYTIHAEWCLPRQHDRTESVVETSDPGVSMFYNLQPQHGGHGPLDARSDSLPVILSPGQNKISSLKLGHPSLIVNPAAESVILQVNGKSYLVPARARFLLSTIAEGQQALSIGASMLVPLTLFDLILMDPPWANRSVRRARTYSTSESQVSNPFLQTVPIVRDHLAQEGWVAVWQTNKWSVRAEILRAFQDLDLYLNEEWVWVKTSTCGEPVCQLDGIWKMPFEVLLLFRRTPVNLDSTVKRRIICAVPDLHSRKPCLRALFDDLLPEPYHALELFARSLTKGWWCWGDEVLKFQDESDWVDRRRHQVLQSD